MDITILDHNLELLVGHSQAKHLLTKGLVMGSCSAYLLVGPPYVGKGFLARLMAASLHNKDNTQRPHPDTVIFDDILAKNSGDSDENQWKQSVDDFIHAIYLSPVQSSKKVGIVENIDRFSPQALNALLKTLEEPPARAVLILTAREATDILPTIISRVQVVRLHYLSDAEITDYLQTQQAKQIPEIIALANGAVGMTSRLLQDDKLLDKSIKGMADFGIWLQKDVYKILQLANIKDRDEAIVLVQMWLNLAHRAWLGKLNNTTGPLADLAQNYSTTDFIRIIDRLKSVLLALENNANVRIALEATLLSIV
ncbi:MAG: AAA family ATPase [Patescibacteria group bacterium]|jgi:DNA polymerase-3 subunit delta'